MKNSNSKKTVVIGASTNPTRYSYMAVVRLLNFNHPVVAIGIKEGEINGTKIITGFPDEKNVHTVTLYINPEIQKGYYKYILSLKPKRIIFNPGTENPELNKLAEKNNIETTENCTLVMLSTDEY